MRELEQYKTLPEENMQRCEIKANMIQKMKIEMKQMKNEMKQNDRSISRGKDIQEDNVRIGM